MLNNDAFASVMELFDAGHFNEARTALHAAKTDLQRSNASRYLGLTAELFYLTGDFAEATRACDKLLRESGDPVYRAVARKVLGEISANQLDFEASLAHFSAARTQLAGERSTDTRAAVELSYWGWFLGVLPLESAESDFAAVRRAVIANGDPNQFAELRFCALRVEARKGNLIEAERHWSLAARLVEQSNHLKLLAKLWLNGCSIALLRGDARTAIECVERAETHADQSGYFRSIVGAKINRAHALLSVGDLSQARAIAEDAVAASQTYRQLHVAALDCLANIQVALKEVASAEVTFAEIAKHRPSFGTKPAPHWDVLSELSSRVALAKAKTSAIETAKLVEEGLKTAEASRDRTWITRMELARAELLLDSGDIAGATNSIVRAAQASQPSPEIVARTAALKGLASMKVGDSIDASSQHKRGLRIADAIENASLLLDIRGQLMVPDAPVTSKVDDAAALVDLSGYPHVLAREAYALLELAGATEAMALVAKGDQGTRCIATRGWSEDEARAAADTPGDRLLITCGMHRDESWEIVAALKPALNDRCTAVAIRKLVDTAVTLDRYRREEKQRSALWPADTLETDGGLWISEQMTELLSIARRIAPADISVLLTGETGTGKEVMARAIHRASGRGNKPFVPFNCTAVPREMLESQLFGYRKGAFTGAHNGFDGVIRAAAGGTLFLDEIAEIGPDLQPKLLRFLETREVHGLGEPHPVKVDVRVVAATNADLESLVAEGHFREDLFYRLNVVRLRLPPLRERREEIPPLIDHYLRSFAEQQKKGRLTLDDETLEFLVLYRWPGNVRQLVNEISRIVAYAEPDSRITPAMLSPEVQASRRTVRVLPGEEPEIRVRLDQPLGDAVDAIERVMVIRALERANGNYENAARLLGISRKGLFLKRRRWGMQRQQAS
jgi:DNA-binding NtrC family response regulator/tetratricopeptide (TPR) repeat protein